jgi:hypothetical protein
VDREEDAMGWTVRSASFVAAAGLLAGCNNETLFKSNFDQTAVGQPPAAAQAVGTAALDGPPGAVTITRSRARTASG